MLAGIAQNLMGKILFLKKARPAKWIIEKSKTKLKNDDQLTKLNSLAYPVLMGLLFGNRSEKPCLAFVPPIKIAPRQFVV